MKSVCFSDRFRHDIEDLMCSASGLVVRGILETMALDPDVALELVHQYLEAYRVDAFPSLVSSCPPIPYQSYGVCKLSQAVGSKAFGHYLEIGYRYSPTLIYDERLGYLITHLASYTEEPEE